MESIQIFGIIVAAFMIFRATYQCWKRKMKRSVFIIWSSIWFVVIVVAVLPGTTTIVAKLFGIGRGIDVVVYLSIMVMYFLGFKLYNRVEETRKEITKLVREIAYMEKKK